MRISVIEHEYSMQWNISTPKFRIKPIYVYEDKIHVEFTDARAFQSGSQNLSDPHRVIKTEIDLTPEQARILAGDLMRYADEQGKKKQQEQED